MKNWLDYSGFGQSEIISPSAIRSLGEHLELSKAADAKREFRDCSRAMSENSLRGARIGYSVPNDFATRCTMPCVYYLKTEGGYPYIGQTTDLDRRVKEHILSPDSSMLTGRYPAEKIELVWEVAPCGKTDSQNQDLHAQRVENFLHNTDLHVREAIFRNPETLGYECYAAGVLPSPDFVDYEESLAEKLNDAYCLNQEWLDKNLQSGKPKPYPSINRMARAIAEASKLNPSLAITRKSLNLIWRSGTAEKGKRWTCPDTIKEHLFLLTAYCICGDIAMANHVLATTALLEALFDEHAKRHRQSGTPAEPRSSFF